MAGIRTKEFVHLSLGQFCGLALDRTKANFAFHTGDVDQESQTAVRQQRSVVEDKSSVGTESPPSATSCGGKEL